MPEGQEAIYYLTGESRTAVENSPHLEALQAEGYEVLLLTDPVDEIWVDAVGEFEGKPLQSVAKGQVDLQTEEEKSLAQEREADFADLLAWMGTTLDEEVKQVRLSTRLTTSPACVVGDTNDMTPTLEKMYKAMGQELPPVKRILELNPTHPLVLALQDAYGRTEEADRAGLAETAELLLRPGPARRGRRPGRPGPLRRAGGRPFAAGVGPLQLNLRHEGRLQAVQSLGHRVECRPGRTLAQRAQEFFPESPPVRELVATLPTPRRDHRENELPALVQQPLVDVRVVLADRLGNVGEVELDGSTAARLEVDEQRAVLRAEHVARMRLAVEQLLHGAAVVDRPSQASQSAAEEHAVCVGELRREIRVGDDFFRLRDPIREPRARQLNLAHAGVQQLQRLGVVDR